MAYGYARELEDQIHAQSCGRPFGTCQVCGLQQIPQSATACNECLRLKAMGMAVPRDPGSGVKDTQVRQSNPSNDHSGYSDSIPNTTFPPKKERV